MPRTTPAPRARDALDRLRELVDADGRSVAAVAKAMAVSRSQLSQVLNGGRRDPQLSTVARVLAALGKTWADLD